MVSDRSALSKASAGEVEVHIQLPAIMLQLAGTVNNHALETGLIKVETAASSAPCQNVNPIPRPLPRIGEGESHFQRGLGAARRPQAPA